MYNPALVQPMREELTNIGVKELTTAGEVEKTITEAEGTVLVVVNSVCGCAAGAARPGVALALKHGKTPDLSTTVFAGQDKEATEKARSYFVGFPPSSPSIALLKGGEVLHMLHRHDIEGSSAEEIAAKLTSAFDQFC